MICPSCKASAPDGSRFCPSCAAPLTVAPDALTREASPASQAAVAAALARAPGVGRLVSSNTIAVGGFTPGAILADRYRIIGLLGRGGMGEVYRADDLKLGQPVALKFLPRDLARDPVRRERFIGEVRIARQVSHPNLCRVYDIGELDGQYFLTMEYIDGEDLASLLRRIGMLHGPKALDIARQLCAGLAAAHDKGVLHRDLKPANVMIDGRGRVRITDFGLALAAGDSQASDEMAGTPAYMAPEQLAGQAATRASDIYALGLVLYELYTGKRTFTAQTLAELRSQKTETTPVAPSEFTHDVDPLVERVIMRCLEKDPRARPSSVAHVAAALPGGDPLAAALAAGETPSPEMVAASGSSEGFSPRGAWLGLASIVASLAVILTVSTPLHRRIPFDKPADVLADRAHQILASLGYSDPAVGSAYGFAANQELIDYISSHDRSPARWDHLPAEAIRFWYRQRPAVPLMREGFAQLGGGIGISASEPPMDARGDVLVWLDPQGRLLELSSMSSETEDVTRPVASFDWAVMFREAGLDSTQWAATTPRYLPTSYADQRNAWSGVSTDRPQDPISLEAAAVRGRLVSLKRVGPWSTTGHFLQRSGATVFTPLAAITLLGVFLIVMITGVLLAQRNLRIGRGDRRGARRLARLTFGLGLATWVLANEHVLAPWELMLAIMAVSRALLYAAITWLLYIALEPFVRRRWPRVLVSWNRLLSGNVRDPLVGRDLLGGLAMSGVILAALVVGQRATLMTPTLVMWFDLLVRPTRTFFQSIAFFSVNAIWLSLAFMFTLLLLRMLVRKDWLVVAVCGLIAGVVSGLGNTEHRAVAFLLSSMAFGAAAVIPFRFGLVGCAAGYFMAYVLNQCPITIDPSAWYAGPGIAVVLLILALAGAAFVISVGGRPLFGRMALED